MGAKHADGRVVDPHQRLVQHLGHAAVVGRGSGIDDRAWMRKVVAIRDGLRRARDFAADPIALLAVAGGADVAAMTGFLVEAAVRRTPVLLDGVMSAAAALVASAITPSASVWWRAAHRSTWCRRSPYRSRHW